MKANSTKAPQMPNNKKESKLNYQDVMSEINEYVSELDSVALAALYNQLSAPNKVLSAEGGDEFTLTQFDTKGGRRA